MAHAKANVAMRLLVFLLFLDVTVCTPNGGSLLSNGLNLITITAALLAAVTPEEIGLEPDNNKRKHDQKSHNKRKRRLASSIFEEAGPCYVRRAYRMHEPSFWKLLKMPQPHMTTTPENEAKKRGAKNGFTSPASRLSTSLRHFAGGRADDVALVHGISHSSVFESVWEIVDAVNACPQLEISFPRDHIEQRQIAAGFMAKSKANFDNVVGAIDGMLIWIEKPHLTDCENATVGPKKFFCGRKKKFGLNMQGVCDHEGRFLDISIGHPASTADYLCFKTSGLYESLEKEANFLAPGLVLFGDNAYVNTTYMATPFKAVKSGEKDDYNFYHSQVRIKIECAFGMFVNRWGILRRALPATMKVKKITRLVMCLARLHNYCITERVGSELPLPVDAVEISAHGGMRMERNAYGFNDSSPEQLLHGGDHFDDVDPAEPKRIEARARRALNGRLPRDFLVDKVVQQGLIRPTPKQWNEGS